MNIEAPSAAHSIVETIKRRVPGWNIEYGKNVWIARNPDPEWVNNWVMVDARNLFNLPSIGPTVSGGNRAMSVRIHLPEIIDQLDIDRVVNALTAAGVLPTKTGMFL